MENSPMISKEINSIANFEHHDSYENIPPQSASIAKSFKKRKNIDLSCLSPDEKIDFAIITLTKPSYARNTNDIKLLVESTINVKFFMELMISDGPETHEQCCKYMEYEKFKKDEIVFELGSIGAKFFIILKGSIGILVEIPRQVEEILPTGEKIIKNEFILTEVKILGNGSSFGELALLEKKPRAATIICKEDTHFAVLQSKYFDKILKDKERKKLFDHIEFLRSWEIFNFWSYNALKNLFYHTTLKQTNIKNVIYKEGDDSNAFYLIKSGEFQIEFSIDLDCSKKSENLFSKFSNYQSKYNNFAKNTIKRRFKNIILGEKEFFGAEELIQGIKREKKVTCLSNKGELIIINKKEFFRRIWSDQKSQEIILFRLDQQKLFENKRRKDYINIEESFGFLKPLELIEIYNKKENKNFLTPNSIFSHHKSSSNQITNQSIIKLLDESLNDNGIIETEPSKQKIDELLNLESFSFLHNDTMNLHKKIKSIEFLPSEKIRSKIDIMKSLRDSFKSPEVLKLQAFKTYDKLAKQTEFYKLFSEKKTLNNNHEFILPPILKKKIEEKNYLIKKLMEKEGKDRKFFIKKYENNHEAIKINNNETTREKTYENQYKKILHKKSLSFKEMKNNLPLKYNVEKYLK